ncbi:hypothetical protein [Phytohabitans kaempferiae]|uniref:LytR/CpsA/Psr regulator C-terminal domain-containing protein n=1 Tax=Phytohabitans kaempferiae TaxID=1620943 RepID=A0ABV6MBT6_9ACTN
METETVTERRSDTGARIGWTVPAAAALLALIALPLLRWGDGWSAWTVEGRPDGSATVRIRDLREADGLERLLAEQGIPAYVTFAPEGTTCAAGTGPSDVATGVVTVDHAEDALVVRIERMNGGSRLALTAFLHVGGDIVVDAAIVPLDRPRCALAPI